MNIRKSKKIVKRIIASERGGWKPTTIRRALARFGWEYKHELRKHQVDLLFETPRIMRWMNTEIPPGWQTTGT